MKKALIALATLGAISSLAYAESNVTLYGIVDVSVSSQKTFGVKDGANTVTLNSGLRSGSRWGIRGIEELGNGYQVGFILEQGFAVDNGTQANGVADQGYAFSREAKLFVQGGFGQIGFGRLGTLAGGAESNNILTGWALGASYSDQGSWTKLAKANGRADNAVAYVSPNVGGFKLSLMYSNGLSYENADEEYAGGDTNKWSDNSHYYGVGAQYTYGGFTNSLIFEAVDNKGGMGTDVKTPNDHPAYLINLGLGYDFGGITPMFAYQYNWQENGVKDNVFGLSAKIRLGGGDALIGARYLFGKNDGAAVGQEDKRRVWTINAAYEYPLSKRTMMWAYAGYADGSKALDRHKTAGQKLNYNGYQVAVGMTHSF